MNSDNINNESSDTEDLWSSLDNYNADSVSETEFIEGQLIAIPASEKVTWLLALLSSKQRAKTKNVALLKLESIFLSLDLENYGSDTFEDYKCCLIKLLLSEENKPYIPKLLLVCASLIKLINKNKSHKWPVIADFVIACVSCATPGLTEMIRKFVESSSDMFGHNNRSRLIEYKKFLMRCMQEFPNYPKVTLFAMETLNELVLEYKNMFCIKTLRRLIPTLMDAMEVMVPAAEGKEFLNYLKLLLYDSSELFRKYIERVISTVLKLLKIPELEKSLVTEIHDFIVEIIEKFPNEFTLKCASYVYELVNSMLCFHLSNYPSDPMQFFHNYCNLPVDCKEGSLYSCSCVRKIAAFLESDIWCPTLSTIASKLLESTDWIKIDMAIQLYNIILCSYQSPMIQEPQSLFNTISPHFISNNCKIVYSMINLTKSLCEAFPQDSYNEFNHQALSTVINSTVSQSCIQIKLLALDTIGSIYHNSSLKKFDINTNDLIRLVMNVLSVISECADADVMLCWSESFYNNIGYVYRLANVEIRLYIPEIITYLLGIIDRALFMPFFDYPVRCLLNCISETAFYYAETNCEDFFSMVVTFVGEFNSKHNFSSEIFEIQPCFFSLLEDLARFKSVSFMSLLPKLGASLNNFFQLLAEQNFTHKRNGIDFKAFTSSYESDYYLPNQSSDYITALCRFISLLVENYCEEFAPYIETYMYILYETLRNAEGDALDDTAEGICLLLKSAFIHGKAEGAQKAWNSHLKNEFLSKMKHPSNLMNNNFLDMFTRCVTIDGFGNPLSLDDLLFLGDVFCNIIDELSQTNEEFLQSRNHQNNESFSLSYSRLCFNIDMTLSMIQECIHDLMPLYQENIIDILVPIYKRVILHPKVKQWELFFQFLLFLLDEIIDFVPKSVMEKSELLPIVLKFILDILSRYCECGFFEKAIKLKTKLKNMYPNIFDEQLEFLSPQLKEMIEKLVDE